MNELIDNARQLAQMVTTLAMIGDRAEAGQAVATWCRELPEGGEALSLVLMDLCAFVHVTAEHRWDPEMSGKVILQHWAETMLEAEVSWRDVP